jgi:hypothetical protein
MKPTVHPLQPELSSMFIFAHHNRLLPRTHALLSAVVFPQSTMNQVSRISAQAPPGKLASRIR